MPKTGRTALLLSCLVIVCTTTSTPGQEPAEPPFTLKQVGPNVWSATDNWKAKATAGANAGFVIGDDGVAVIDTFASADAAKQLLAEIRKLTKLPVKFVINTHYHLDHVMGNGVFMEAGAVVLAHRNVRGWIHPENLKFFGKDIKPEQKAFIESIKAPMVGYDQAVNLHLGAREIQIRSFPGHTGGDSVVLIPDAKTVFLGDLFWRNTLPNLIDATTKTWIETLDTLAKGEGATFVPGHGENGNAEDVLAFREYLAMLQKLIADARAQAKSDKAVVDAMLPQLTEKYGQWNFFKFLAEPNIVATEAELSGKKRVPQPQAAK